MKIGIITIHKSPNYGACFQSFALYSFVTSLGHDCEIIDLHRPTHNDYVYSQKYVEYRKPQESLSQQFKKSIKRLLKGKYASGVTPLTDEAAAKFEQFNNPINCSIPYLSIDQLYANPPLYDVYMTGSDQLWNPTMRFCIEPYFLTFAPSGARKISYATSVAVSSLRPNEERDYCQWLKDYESIAVREQSAVKLVSRLSGKEVTQVSDPTFLLSYDEWTRYSSNIDIHEPYILLFTLGYRKDLAEYVLKLSKESGIKMVYLCLSHPYINNVPYTIERNAGPSEFLTYIANAEMVITDSFHGTAFCMHMHTKNFFTYISNKNRGSRITDMLDKFNLSDHLLDDSLDKSYDQLCSYAIHHQQLADVMSEERKRCADYLKHAINKS